MPKIDHGSKTGGYHGGYMYGARHDHLMRRFEGGYGGLPPY